MNIIICVLVLYTVEMLLDYINLFLIYDKFLRIEHKQVKKGKIVWIALMLVIGYIYGLQSAGIMYNKIFSLCICIPYYLKMIPVLWSYFARRKKDIPLVIFYQLLVEMLSQGMELFSKESLSKIFYIFFVSDLCRVLVTGLVAVFLLILLLIRKNNILKIYFGDLSTLQYMIFCLALFTTGLLEADVIVEYPDKMLLKVLVAGSVLVVCILIGQMILVRESDTRKGKVINILDGHMEQMIDYYRAMTEQENQTRKFRHDIKNLLLALHSMVAQGENEKALTYIEEMNGLCKKTTQRYDTGNFIANALLSTKSVAAEKADTDIQFDGFIPETGIENVDLVILLSNIVDNAVEACEKLSGRKTIVVESVLQKHMWILAVKNPVERKVKIQANAIETTKNDKEFHGYGIQNIKQVVKKYDGNLKFACEDKSFSVRTMLSLKSEDR